MENKRPKIKVHTDSEYIKKLQKIVYQKQQQLQVMNNNLQQQQSRSNYHKTIKQLQETILAQNKQLREKEIQIFHLVQGKYRQLDPTTHSSSSKKRLESTRKLPQDDFDRRICPKDHSQSVELLKQLKQNRRQFEEAKEKIMRLAGQMETVKGYLEAEENRNQELARELGEMGELNQCFERELEAARVEVQGLRTEIRNLESQNSRISAEVAQLQKIKTGYSEAIQPNREQTELKAKIDQLNQQIIALQSTVQKQRLVITFLQSNLQQIRSIHSRQLQNLISAHNSQLSQLQTQHQSTLSTLQSKLSVTSSKLSQSQNTINLLTNQLEMLTMRYNVLENKYIILQSEKISQEIQAIDHIKTACTKTKQKEDSMLLETSGATFLKIYEEIEGGQMKTQIEEMKTENANLREEINEMERQSMLNIQKIAKLEEQNEKIKEQIMDLRDREKKALEGEMKAMENEKATFQETLALKSKIQTIKRENQPLHSKLLFTEKQLSSIKIQIKTLRQQNAQLLTEIKNKDEQLQKIRISIHESKKQLINVMNRNDDISKELEQLRKQKRKLLVQAQSFKETCKRQNWFSELVNHSPQLKPSIDKAQSAYQIKCVIFDCLCQWIVSCLSCQVSIKSAIQILRSIHDRRLQAAQHLCLLVQQTIKYMIRSQIKSQSKITLSHIELPVNKTQFGVEMSHILNKVQQNDTVIIHTAQTAEDKEHNEQAFLENLQKQAQEHVSVQEERKTLADVSQMRENMNMVKAVNQQLFTQIQSKQKQLTTLNKKLKELQQFSIKQQHFKSNIKSLLKETKPNDRTIIYLNNICSILGLRP